MQLQGIRIEYFINGGMAIFWLYPLVRLLEMIIGLNEPLIFTEAHFIILIPFSYIVGMFISFIARMAFKSKTNIIKKEIFSTHLQDERIKQVRVIIEAAKFNKDVHDALEISLTRQQIARGNLINLLITILVVPTYLFFAKGLIWWRLLLFMFTLGILWWGSWKMWISFLKTYYDYLCEIYKLMKGKNN